MDIPIFRPQPQAPPAQESWASLVFPRVMRGSEFIGCILILQPQHLRRSLWKIPGGSRNYAKGDLSPEDTARHELPDETGLEAQNLQLVESWEDMKHTKHLFVNDYEYADLGRVILSLKIGDDGEIPAFFNRKTIGELLFKDLMLRKHKQKLVAHGLVPHETF